jgi:hypothetical protein
LLLPAWDALQGRHLIAGSNYSPGQVLLQEAPLTVLPTKAVRGSRCWCCLGPLGGSPHPCPGCPLVRPPAACDLLFVLDVLPLYVICS